MSCGTVRAVSGLTSDAQTISIEWKSDAVNLTKKFPRGVATASSEEGDDEGFDGDEGSFFHFFTEQFDPNSVSRLVVSSPITPLGSHLHLCVSHLRHAIHESDEF